MARRRHEGLERGLGVDELSSTAYGNVGSSIYYTLGLVAAFALGLTPVVFAIAALFFLCTAATYAEATAMHPEAGGSSSFARRAFDELVSFVAAWAQLLGYIFAVAIAAFFVPHYLGGLAWDWLRSPPGDVIFGAVVIGALVVANVVGIKEWAGPRRLLAVVDLMTQLLLVLVGAVLVLSPDTLAENVRLGDAPTWKGLLVAIPIGMLAFTGIETISNMADEAKDEGRTIPAAINRVRVAVIAIYFTLPAVALSALPVTREAGEYRTRLGQGEDEGGYVGDPVLGVVRHLDLGPLQDAGVLYVGLLAATILLVATNAALIGVSRLVYSMGIHRQLPDALRRLHPRFDTPWLAIVVFGAAAVVALLPGRAEFLAYTYAFGAMLSFTIAHAAVIRLRLTEPDADRPYRGPANLRVRGREVPLLAVLGAVGTAFAFAATVVLHPGVAAVGFGWLVFGVATYVAFRRREGLDLRSTYKVAISAPVVDHEAEYDSVLVPLVDARYDEHLMATATKLAARKRRGIHVLALVTVPNALDIDATMKGEEAAADSAIEQARIQGGRRVSGHVEKIRAGQAGRRIVEGAIAMRATAIVMSLPTRIGGVSLFGKTLETVLAERPCRVIIESAPKGAPARAGRRVALEKEAAAP